MSDSAQPIRWEYNFVPIVQVDPSEKAEFLEQTMLLNALGAAGWELVTIAHECFILKRHAEIS